MTEEPRLWPAMLVAALMVLSSAAAMYVGAQNEPDVPQDCRLSYSSSVFIDNNTYQGSLVTIRSGSDEQIDVRWDVAPWEDGSGPTIYTSIFGGSYLLDIVNLETPFGEKSVCRFISLFTGHGIVEGQPEIRVTYSGCGSHLTYREDVITPEYRASFVLVEADFTEIFGIDLEPSEDTPWIGDQDFITTVTFDGAYDSDAVLTQDLRYEVNATNYVHYYFGQDEVLDMVDGGEFQYDEERTVIGNGSLEFEPTGEWFLRFVGPTGEAPHHFVMDIRAS